MKCRGKGNYTKNEQTILCSGTTSGSHIYVIGVPKENGGWGVSDKVQRTVAVVSQETTQVRNAGATSFIIYASLVSFIYEREMHLYNLKELISSSPTL